MKSSSISLYLGNAIERFGQSAMVIAIGTDQKDNRFAEVYVLKSDDVYSHDASLTYTKVLNFEGISSEVCSDNSITMIAYDMAKGHLSHLLYEAIKQYGRTEIPYDVRLNLEAASTEDFRAFIFQCVSKEVADKLTSETKLDEIKELFDLSLKSS